MMDPSCSFHISADCLSYVRTLYQYVNISQCYEVRLSDMLPGSYSWCMYSLDNGLTIDTKSQTHKEETRSTKKTCSPSIDVSHFFIHIHFCALFWLWFLLPDFFRLSHRHPATANDKTWQAQRGAIWVRTRSELALSIASGEHEPPILSDEEEEAQLLTRLTGVKKRS